MQREDLIRQGGTELRAADADREATADQLRRAHVEGRLETAELEERLERAYAAKTYRELDAIVADLPRPRAADSQHGRQGQRDRTRSYRPHGLRLVPIAAVIVALAITSHAIWLLWWLVIFAFVRSRRRGYRRYARPI
jgi:hypothetical protein